MKERREKKNKYLLSFFTLIFVTTYTQELECPWQRFFLSSPLSFFFPLSGWSFFSSGVSHVPLIVFMDAETRIAKATSVDNSKCNSHEWCMTMFTMIHYSSQVKQLQRKWPSSWFFFFYFQFVLSTHSSYSCSCMFKFSYAIAKNKYETEWPVTMSE